MSRLHSNLLLILTAVIWGSAFVAQSTGMDHVGPLTFTGVRFLIGAAIVAPFTWREWRAIGNTAAPLRGADGRWILALGVLLALGAVLQQVGIMSTTVTNAGFLTALYVPLVPVLGWVLWRHLPHWSAWMGALACLGGAFLLSGAQTLSIGSGDLWVIASTVPWALHVLMVGRVAHRMQAPFLVAAGQFAVCGVLALLGAFVFEPIQWAGLQAAALPLAYTGVLSVGVGFTLQVLAQRHAQATDAAIVLSSETLFAALFGFVLMGDRLSLAGFIGCGLIFVSMLAVQLLPILVYRSRQVLRSRQP